MSHWIIRVGDGENLKRSKYPFWGVKRGLNNNVKSIVKKFKEGDVLWFLTNKKFGGKVIKMAEYDKFYDRQDEPFFTINTYSNIEQNWIGDDSWDIQIHYKNIYMTEKQNIDISIQCAANILKYETFKDRIKYNLYEEYNNFIHYAETI